MKRILFALLGALMMLPAFSQEFRPLETWPFLYEEFQPGATRTRDGALTESLYNVSVADGSLMYIKDGIIMKPDMSRVYTARVGEDVYVNIMGRMYRLLSELDCGNVVLGTEVDRAQLEKVNIGYGKSSVASAQNLSLVAIEGGNWANKSMESFASTKYDGKELPLKQTWYLHKGLDLIPATRQDVLNIPGVDKKAATDFFKQEKIKWKDTASLEKVLSFINEQTK